MKMTAVTCIAAALLVVGCDRSKNSSGGAEAGGAGANTMPSLGLPKDYFPTDIGRRWTYRITLTKGADALNHEVVRWPRGEGGLKTESRGRYYLADDERAKELKLILSVKASAKKQGPLEYPDGYELAIERDDLRIFERSTKVYWAISHSGRYEVTLVMMRSPHGPGAPSGGPWGSYGVADGHAFRVFFFGEKPGTGLGLSEENDMLHFVGPSRVDGNAALVFVRTVSPGKRDASDSASDFLNKGFEETLVFVKGVGLSTLVQKVDDKVTMRWDLE